jgi:AraC-like DNA-binding protein
MSGTQLRVPAVSVGGEVSVRGKDGFSSLNISTNEVPESERASMLREFYSRGLAKAEVEVRKGEPVEARFTSHALPEAQLLLGTLIGARIVRTRHLMADGNDSLALFVNRSGTIGIASRGRDALLQPGEAVLTSAGEETSFERFAAGECFTLRVPRRVLEPLTVDVDDAVMRIIPEKVAGLRLLVDYAVALVKENAFEQAALRQLGVSHLHDLLALVLDPTEEAGAIAERRGARAARLRQAKLVIVNNCWRQDLSIAAVAGQLGVTPRYLQRIFESDGKTFSSFLVEQRLKRAHRMLRGTEFAERPVSSIAYDVGFGDLSYFNRCFRRAFGATPSDVRSGEAD